MIIDIKFMKQKKTSPKWVVSCVIFLCAALGHTQTITDTIPASQYFKKGDAFLIDRKLDSAVVYFEKALPIYRNAKTWERVARCYNKISESHRFDKEYEESLKNAHKALEIIDQYLKKDNREKAFAYDNIGDYYVKFKKDYESANENYYKALKIRKMPYSHHHEIAISYLKIGNVFFRKGQYDRAIRYYEKLVENQEKRSELFNEIIGKAFFNLGISYNRKEEYENALRYLQKSLLVYEKIFHTGHESLASSYEAIGRVYQKMGNDDMAILYLRKNLLFLIGIYGRKNERIIEALNLIGMSHRNKGRYEKALNCYNQAININNGLPTKEKSISYVYNNIGVIFINKGEYDKALIYYRKALKINLLSSGEENISTAINYNNIGSIYKLKGYYYKALMHYEKALIIREKLFNKFSSHVANSNNDIGQLYTEQKQYEKSLYYCTKALKIRVHIFGEKHPDVADSYTSLGKIYKIKKEYEAALENYNKSLEIQIIAFGKSHPEVAQSYNDIAQVHLLKNDSENAIINYKKAIVANTIPGTDQYLDLNILLSTLEGQAKTYKKLFQKSKDIGMLNNAINTYQKADTLINKIRQTFTNYQDKVGFAKKATAIYQGAIQAQLLLYDHNQDQKSLDQAFLYAEKSKANTLKELLATSNAKNFTGLPMGLLELEKELRINNSFYQSKINKERSSQATDSTKITNYESRLFDINRRQDSLTNILEKNYPKYYQLKHENNIVSVVDIQKSLKENTTLLEFFVADSNSYAFTISKNNLAVQELKTQDLTNRIEHLREAITSKNVEDYKQSAFGLYNELFAPITDKLVGDELIIIPDGLLWHLNFELLLTQKDASNNPKTLSYLLKDYAVTYANSANLLFTTQKNQGAEKRQECLAFSFTDSTNIVDTKTMSLATLRDTGDDLPGTRKEIRAISDIIDGQYYFGSQAIEANFKKNASQYNILHLALHGDVDNKRPENSKLYFTKSKDTLEDNLLYSHELFALDIPAELTVLSACNTGTGKIAKGEGIMSLGSAFQYAGTKSLLLSSWEVSDQTTPELMKYFYTNLKTGMNKAKALQQAKLQYLKTANVNRVHPFYWGGFYLVGDSAPITFSDNNQLYWVLGILMLIVLLGSLFLYRRKKGV